MAKTASFFLAMLAALVFLLTIDESSVEFEDEVNMLLQMHV